MLRAFLKTLREEAIPALVSGIAMLVALIVTASVTVPQLRTFLVRHAAADEYRLLVKTGDSHETVRRRLAADQELLAEKRSALTGGLAGYGDISATLQLLMEQGRNAGVRFVRVQPQTEQRDNRLVLYPVLLETSTSYKSLVRLIGAFESIPHLLRIERIGITSMNLSSVSVNILVTCFLQPESKKP
jgi:hypothetical protein